MENRRSDLSGCGIIHEILKYHIKLQRTDINSYVRALEKNCITDVPKACHRSKPMAILC